MLVFFMLQISVYLQMLFWDIGVFQIMAIRDWLYNTYFYELYWLVNCINYSRYIISRYFRPIYSPFSLNSTQGGSVGEWILAPKTYTSPLNPQGACHDVKIQRKINCHCYINYRRDFRLSINIEQVHMGYMVMWQQ